MIDSDDDRGSKKYDSEDSDSEENNLSFEQLKNELIVLKRKKKETKIAQVNENQVLNSSRFTETTGPGYGFGSGIVGGEASPEDSADHWRVMGLLEASKKRAKTVVEMFLPSVFGLRRLIRGSNYSAVQDLCAVFSLKSADHGLFRLNCWYCTLQEVTGILITHLLKPSRQKYFKDDNKDTPGDAPLFDSQALQRTGPPSAPSIGGVFGDRAGSSSPSPTPGAKLDASVVGIINEMVDAIELAIWDAAVDKTG